MNGEADYPDGPLASRRAPAAPATAREHAVFASDLLAGARRFEDKLEALEPEERLQMAAMGGIGRANNDLRWTVDLATAHALAALAMAMTEDGRVASGREVDAE